MVSKLIKTQFDGKKALILPDHPHQNETAECIGAENIAVGLALRFRNNSTGDEFYVMKPQHIRWLKQSKG
jgi:hypothetical protein